MFHRRIECNIVPVNFGALVSPGILYKLPYLTLCSIGTLKE